MCAQIKRHGGDSYVARSRLIYLLDMIPNGNAFAHKFASPLFNHLLVDVDVPSAQSKCERKKSKDWRRPAKLESQARQNLYTAQREIQ